MAADSTLGKKSALAIASTLAWLALLVAFVATAANITINNLNHVGDTASSIVNRLSTNSVAIDSLLNDFRKNADPKTVAEIDQNRLKIKQAIASLAGDKNFRDSLASMLNKISVAVLNGSETVTVDFGPLATKVADVVNAAAGQPVISKKELAKIRPQEINLSKQARNFSSVRNRIWEVMLAWALWLIFLGVVYLFKKWKILGTAGWQLISIGIIFIAARFLTSIAMGQALENSPSVSYQRDLAQEVLKALFGPIWILSVTMTLAGMVLVAANQFFRNRLRPHPIQMSPSVVA